MARGSSSVGAIQGGRVAVAVTLDDSQYVLGLAKVKSSLKTLSAGLNTFSNSVIRAGMALGVPMAAALRQFTEFDHQMRVVRAVTQSSEAQFAALTARARELGKTTSWTAREVAEGMTSLGRMGWKPKEIDAAISAMMDLARATDSDVATVSTLASNTMRAFKASSREATHYADVLTVAANKSSQTVVDIGEAMTIVGPLAKQAGQSFEDTAAALMVMANNGVRGSIAGTALRNAIVKLNDATRQETLTKYGVKVRDVYGNMRNLARIMGELFENTRGLGTGELTSLSAEIFGLRGMLGGSVLVNNIKETEEVIKAVGEAANGEANRVARGIEEGLWGAVRIAISAFQDLGLAIGNAFSQDLQNSLQRVTTFVRGLSTWVKQNKEQVKQAAKWVLQCLKYAIELKAVLTLASITAGIVKFADAFGKLATQILAAKTAMEGLAAAQGTLGAVGAGGAVAAGARGAAGAAAGGAAAAGGGALGTAANGTIVASSASGMMGSGGVRSAWRQWRESRKQVDALKKEAAAKSAVRRASEANARKALNEVYVSRDAMRAAQKELAAREALRKASRMSQGTIATQVSALRSGIYERGQRINATGRKISSAGKTIAGYRSLEAYRGSIVKRQAENARRALYRERAMLRAEQIADRGALSSAVGQQAQIEARVQAAIQAERQARGTAFSAGGRLARAQTASVAAQQAATASRAPSAAANAALMAGMSQAGNAAANFTTAILKCVGKIGLLAAVAGTAYWAFKKWEQYLGLKAQLVEQKSLNALAEEDAKQRGLGNLTKITDVANAETVRQQIDWLRRGLGEIVAYVQQQNQGNLTQRGQEMMRSRARGIGEAYGVDADRIIGMAVRAVYNNSYDELNKWMQSQIDWEVGKAKYLFGEGQKTALNLDLQGTEEYKAFYKALGRLNASSFRVSPLTQLDTQNATRASIEDLNIELPKTEDLDEAETSFAESVMSPYEKSMAELSKRQEQYAELIKAKTEELRLLSDTKVGTEEGRARIASEIRRLEAQQAAFDGKIAEERARLGTAENLSRVDRLSGAAADAIRQQAALGPGGQQIAQKMQTGWVARFESMLSKLGDAIRDARANAKDPLGEGGVEVTENERARVNSLSEVFARVAGKLEDLRNLDLGIEAEKTAAASTTGSYKASEVFGQIVATRPIEETAKNTHKQAEIGQKQLRLLEAQNTILRDIKDNSGLVFAS